MKRLVLLSLLVGQMGWSQVIDESSWNEVSPENRVPILTQYASINACTVTTIQNVSQRAFAPTGPGDNSAFKNQQKMYQSLSADKEVVAAIKGYCLSKYISEKN